MHYLYNLWLNKLVSWNIGNVFPTLANLVVPGEHKCSSRWITNNRLGYYWNGLVEWGLIWLWTNQWLNAILKEKYTFCCSLEFFKLHFEKQFSCILKHMLSSRYIIGLPKEVIYASYKNKKQRGIHQSYCWGADWTVFEQNNFAFEISSAGLWEQAGLLFSLFFFPSFLK